MNMMHRRGIEGQNSMSSITNSIPIKGRNVAKRPPSLPSLMKVNVPPMLPPASSLGHQAPPPSSSSSATNMGMRNVLNPPPRPFAMKAVTNSSQVCSSAPNFTGTWQLDSKASDSINDYLEAMGLPLIARQAADKLDLTMIIHQTTTDLNITRKTRIFTDTKHLKFGQESVVRNSTIRLISTPSNIITTTKLPTFRASLAETRSLEGPHRMLVSLNLTLPDRKINTNRYFNRVSESTSLELDDDMINYENPVVDTKRKR